MAAKKKTPAKKSAPKKKSPAKKPVAKAKGKAAPAKKVAAKAAAKKVTAKKPARPVRKSKRPAPKRKVAPKKKVAPKAPKSTLPEAPEALALARTIASVAGEKKAERVLIIDTRARAASVGYDYIVLASGESDRQLSAIYEGVEALLKPQGRRPSSVEPSPDWVCVTYDEGVMAHFLTPDKRDEFDFEGLWKDAPRVS